MTKQEELLKWLANELVDWKADICHMVENTDDSVATSPISVAKIILMGLSSKGVIISLPIGEDKTGCCVARLEPLIK